ncbi:MAG: FHA domain-containing protein [Cyanobacteria bacterium P01_A01_bin.17]
MQQTQQLHLLIDVGQEKVISLINCKYSIGRDLSNDIVLESGTISRFHATLVKSKNPSGEHCIYKLVDGKAGGDPSVNGIMVNEKRVDEHSLVDGDLIHFGGVIKAIFRVYQSTNKQHQSAFGYDHAVKYIHPSYLASNESTAIML